MRKFALLLASLASAVGLCLALLLFTGAYTLNGPAAEAQSATKPNFVFILADDMRKDDLRYMPKTRSLLGRQGKTFSNAYVSYALCCPSRATILRGQYAHNTDIWSNGNGLKIYNDRGYARANLATRLDDAGYRTGLFGMYFNGYRQTNRVPPGWDDWFAKFGGNYYNYDVNDNGTKKHFGTRRGDYLTDVLRRQTRTFIDASLKRHRPFFAYVAPSAPHRPFTPAPRDRHTHDGLKAPRPPSFNERDVSDKPPWIRRPMLSNRKKAAIDNRYEDRAETLGALDDLVGGVVNKLKDRRQLSNTYIVFTSDNGWHHGEHRIPEGKKQPYEESVNVPLLIRGPGVKAGSSTGKLVLNTDYFPTFTSLAGIQTPGYVDGRSLRPVLKGNAAIWRSAILLERRDNGNLGRSFYGIRTSDGRKYFEYRSGFKEGYNLPTDPYELRNRYNGAPRPSGLATRLQALKACAGPGCRSAENG